MLLLCLLLGCMFVDLLFTLLGYGVRCVDYVVCLLVWCFVCVCFAFVV